MGVSITPYGYCGNNPLVRIDPDGRSFDRYQSEYGAVRWFRSSRKRLFFHSEWWTRLGAEYSLELGDGCFLNFYQNVPISLTDSRASALLGILNNDGFKGFLLSNASPLDEEYRHDIVRRSIHHVQNEFLAHPFVRGTFDVLTFVGMGGVESLFSLSSSLCGFAGKHFGRTAIKTSLRAAKGRGVQYTKSSLSLGREMHKGYKTGLADGVATFKEFTGIKGIRPDFVDFGTKTIYELKPFNPRSIQLGIKQLNNYKTIFEKQYPGTIWKTVLDTY